MHAEATSIFIYIMLKRDGNDKSLRSPAKSFIYNMITVCLIKLGSNLNRKKT